MRGHLPYYIKGLQMIRLRYIIDVQNISDQYYKQEVVYRKRLFLNTNTAYNIYYNISRDSEEYQNNRSINTWSAKNDFNFFKHRDDLSLKEKYLFKFYEKCS